jgi:hypothetical protein
MVAHRFHVGDLVAASAMGVPPGPYRVTRLLPTTDSGDINYRAEDLCFPTSGRLRVVPLFLGAVRR